MTLKKYVKEAVKFRMRTASEEYLKLGLIAEVGEVAGKLAKRIRDDVFDEKAFINELGDVLWFIVNLAKIWDFEHELDWRIEITEEDNGDFLEDRMREVFNWANEGIKYEDADSFNSLLENVGLMVLHFGYTFEQVAEANIVKLRDRAARGKIQGNGDER